jgi:hypothetical protein
VKYVKDDGGCLGYPAALLLFSVVDTIGSFHRGRSDMQMLIDGKLMQIRSGGFQHFYILNAEYYGQTLTQKDIKQLYDNFRSLLTHNAVLAPSHFLVKRPGTADSFLKYETRPLVNISAFLELSKNAVELFLGRIEEVVDTSVQAKNIMLKR